MLIDTHAHLNFSDFKDDYPEVIKRAQEKNVVMINVGSQLSTSERAVNIAEQFEKTYAAVGLHPIQLEDFEVKEEGVSFRSRAEVFHRETYELLAAKKKVVAIGECGLDYYHISQERDIFDVKEKQKETLQQQINLANKFDLPLILHCRGSKDNPKDAYLDLLDEIKKNLPKKRGVLHCFGSDYEIAKQFLELGFYLGFTGVITFDKTGQSQNVISQMPPERILSETDCPYLTPEPYRGKRNEPVNVEYVIRKIAEIRQLPYEKAVNLTASNAKALFNLAI